MSFTLRVVFTGVCAFVPQADTAERFRMCVVLPDGRSDTVVKGKSKDGQELRRHRGFIQFKAHHLKALTRDSVTGKSIIPSDFDTLYYLDRQRLTFRCISDVPGLAASQFRSDLTGVATLSDVVPGFDELDPRVLDAVPPNTVLAQVFLDQGTLRGLAPDKRATRVFPRTLANEIVSSPMSSEIRLDVPALSAVEVILTPFEPGGPAARWALSSPEDEIVTVTIANLCDQNPLRWKTDLTTLPPDEDFRWLYTLLSDDHQDALVAALGGLLFPVPQTPVKEAGNGQGANCSPGVTKAQIFSGPKS